MDEEQIKQEFEKVWREINGLKKIGSHIDEETIPLNSKKVSIKEFLIEKKPHKDFHKTLAICYYIEKNGTESFNAKDIENGFREAKEIIPRNINYHIIQNIQKGYLMEEKEKRDNLKAWTLTNTGERFVESGFDK